MSERQRLEIDLFRAEAFVKRYTTIVKNLSVDPAKVDEGKSPERPAAPIRSRSSIFL